MREEYGAYPGEGLFAIRRSMLCPGKEVMERRSQQCGTGFLELFTPLTVNSVLYSKLLY